MKIRLSLTLMIATTLIYLLQVHTLAKTANNIVVSDRLVSVNLENSDLSMVIKEIGERSTPPFAVTVFHSRKISAQFTGIPLEEALHRLIQKNYTLILDKKTHQPLKIFLLQEGTGIQKALLDQDAISDFQEVLKSNPQRIVRAHMILATPLPLMAVKELLVGKNITLHSLQHNLGVQNGGYVLREGETIEEALTNYEQGHKNFLVHMHEQIQQLVDSAPEQEIRDAAKQGLIDLAVAQSIYNEQGLQISHLELLGGAYETQQLTENTGISVDIMLIPERNP